MGIVKVVSPRQAGKIIDTSLSRIERNGFRGRAALARLIRPGNIAASFGPVATASDVLRIETVTTESGIKLAKEAATNELWAGLMGEDPSLEPHFWKDGEVGIKAGEKLPVVGIEYDKHAVRAAQILSKLTGEEWYIPTEAELVEGKDLVVVGENKYGAVFEWTSTNWEEGKPFKVFINPRSGDRNSIHRDNYNNNLGIRFAKRT